MKNMDQQQFLADERKLEKLSVILKNIGILVFEYLPEEDQLVVYDQQLRVVTSKADYLAHLDEDKVLHPEDREKVRAFHMGKSEGPIEVRHIERDGSMSRKEVDAVWIEGVDATKDFMLGSVRDITKEKNKEELLKERAERDQLTKAYNAVFGVELIEEYLQNKNPYDSCGLLVLDLDFFKNVNDNYGHLFGDKVLVDLARVLNGQVRAKDILLRAGGDEFVLLFKDISHPALVKKVMQIVKAVREMTFPENEYSPTCSVGVCFLPENVSGYTYNQLFDNADWALYQAKQNGRNRYIFCDNLKRFELATEEKDAYADIDSRYLHNDVISTAFEIFEKMNSFEAAVKLLMRVIGIRFELDRITIIRIEFRGKSIKRQYQWRAENVPESLNETQSFTKEDFMTLFNSYDEYGTTVFHYDDMHMYSEGTAKVLMQGDIKTVVYTAMYCQGQYIGAMSYVSCSNKRYWTKQQRQQLGELTKIVAAHLGKTQALNAHHVSVTSMPDYDALTGLLSFSKFREEVERIIVGGNADSYVMVYSDFENFKYFNKKYGYEMGDQILKEFSNYIMDVAEEVDGMYFTRVVADQFILFKAYNSNVPVEKTVQKINEAFIETQLQRFPKVHLKIRSGVYPITPDCTNASMAIDAANYARKRILENSDIQVKVYDEKLKAEQLLETDVINEFDSAIEEKEFQVYLQPRVSLKDFSITGAEAVVRWQRPDGSVMLPDSFLPFLENNGRILKLDYYVCEQVVAFLAKNNHLGRKQVPISVNVSTFHAQQEKGVQRYKDILQQYEVMPELLEIELTETATVCYYEEVKNLLKQFQEARMTTVLDDFGAGYSALNSVIDIPVNTFKIDRMFINTCENSEKGLNFLKQIIEMVKGLGYRVVCAGVETEKQVECLKAVGCEEAQGYWFAHPLTIEDYEKLMYTEG